MKKTLTVLCASIALAITPVAFAQSAGAGGAGQGGHSNGTSRAWMPAPITQTQVWQQVVPQAPQENMTQLPKVVRHKKNIPPPIPQVQ
jgi:hypothetical protein